MDLSHGMFLLLACLSYQTHVVFLDSDDAEEFLIGVDSTYADEILKGGIRYADQCCIDLQESLLALGINILVKSQNLENFPDPETYCNMLKLSQGDREIVLRTLSSI